MRRRVTGSYGVSDVGRGTGGWSSCVHCYSLGISPGNWQWVKYTQAATWMAVYDDDFNSQVFPCNSSVVTLRNILASEHIFIFITTATVCRTSKLYLKETMFMFICLVPYNGMNLNVIICLLKEHEKRFFQSSDNSCNCSKMFGLLFFKNNVSSLFLMVFFFLRCTFVTHCYEPLNPFLFNYSLIY